METGRLPLAGVVQATQRDERKRLMECYKQSADILARNRNFIPGGVVSVNRAAHPEIVFVKGQGAYLWDADGNRYIDYHAAFAPHFLGHHDPT